MWRTVSPFGGESSHNQFITQLNQAALSVMQGLDIPIFPWSEFLDGTTEYGRYADGRVDGLHFRIGCECYDVFSNDLAQLKLLLHIYSSA